MKTNIKQKLSIKIQETYGLEKNNAQNKAIGVLTWQTRR